MAMFQIKQTNKQTRIKFYFKILKFDFFCFLMFFYLTSFLKLFFVFFGNLWIELFLVSVI